MTSSKGLRGEIDDKIWVPVVDGPPVTVVRSSPPSLTLARDVVEEQVRVRKRTRPVDKAIGRSRVLGVPAELALLHPIRNAPGTTSGCFAMAAAGSAEWRLLVPPAGWKV